MNIRPLSKELQEKAKSELNEVPERIKDDIEYIKQWLSKQPHLKAKTGVVTFYLNLKLHMLHYYCIQLPFCVENLST